MATVVQSTGIRTKLRSYGVFLPDGETPFPTERHPLVRAIEGEVTRDVEMLVRNARHPDGVLISVTGRPLMDESGALVGATVVFRDITELRRVQRMKEELAAAKAMGADAVLTKPVDPGELTEAVRAASGRS